MEFNAAGAKGLLGRFDFATLFLNELGWDQHSAALSIEISSAPYALKAIAEKRGMVAWLCEAPKGQSIPDRATRKKIEHQVAKTTLEHLIIFTDAKRDEQIWCWSRRETGKPAAVIEHFWYASSGNSGFLQKLHGIAFSLDEEAGLTLPDVTARARAALNVERVTKRFYDQFKIEHKAFLDFISGITDVADRGWYASLMLNRLMFIYFMQRKGFLNGERDYLRNRLDRFQKEKGRDKFYSFYSYFLLRLFHEGLGGKKRNPELEKLLGRIPYLNGGLFEPHAIEEQYPKIAIPDEAFTRIFVYFDRYQWHLDERPLRNDNEINPDVLGYIFEKYINQKQMGAYYTKEDITEYIAKNTAIPFLFDAAKVKCKVAFENPNGPTIWDHLRDNPDRYIYAAVKHGAESPLPAEIAAGVDDVSARTNWNRAAPAEIALPTEIWREVVARRTRYAEVRAKLAAGEFRDINDLVTLNLDVRQFAQDVIERCEGPDLLRAFWKAIEGVTILDPTCGSGAFLFAGLNILEPLYETCLERMEAFVADLKRSGDAHHPKKFEDFKAILAKVSAHPNARYFILKSILLNNLFGVDIMEEAVEICKLRMFLKLAAQVDPDPNHPNLGIEPLPDIDFNIRAGNTLVGYATYDDVKAALSRKLDLDNVAERIARNAADLQQASDVFRSRQMEGDGSVRPADKAALRERLRQLDENLNRHLAAEYGLSAKETVAYSRWLKSHQPFHWFVEFHRIMQSGGFDVIIGNPPYLELSKLNSAYAVRGYQTLATSNLYALCSERTLALTKEKGRLSLIVPLSMFSTPNMRPAQHLMLLKTSELWVSYYSNRPAQLFEGAQNFLSIFVALKSTPSRDATASSEVYTTRLYRWASLERATLFQLHHYTVVDRTIQLPGYAFPKFSSPIENDIARKIFSVPRRLSDYCRDQGPTKNWAVYCYGGVYWTKARNFESPVRKNGVKARSTADRPFYTDGQIDPLAAVSLLNSSTHFWFWENFSDCRNKTYSVMLDFPVDQMKLSKDSSLQGLGRDLMKGYRANSERRVRVGKRGRTEFDEFYPKKSKSLIDKIDGRIAAIFTFDAEETDFISNYDVKYRMGADDEDDEGDQ